MSSAGEFKKNSDIEGLRGIAILFTLIVHIGAGFTFPGVLPAFIGENFELSVGVDLFFVISGYVIARSFSSLVSVMGPSSGVLFSFWLKRAFRLLPTAWLWLIIILSYFSLSQFYFNGEVSIPDIPFYAAILNVMNLYGAHCVAESGASEYCGYFYIHGHYWSLSLEEQFYLLFPIVFLLFSRRMFVVFLLVVVTLQFFWLRNMWSFGWFLRTDALCWGVLLAFFSNSKLYRSTFFVTIVNSKYMPLVMFSLLLFLPWVANELASFHSYSRYGLGVVALISVLIVWIASYDSGIVVRGGRMKKFMLYLGSRSYALYVSHLMVFFMVRNLWDLTVGVGVDFNDTPLSASVLLVFVACFLTFSLSEVSYRFVELPFRDRGRTLANRLLTPGLVKPTDHSSKFVSLTR